ncbi:MAG TPA: type II toxin-antitoxin system RelE/ParE family toxin [Desulfobacter sp.]|nr:type II toxin-antitoxin system RelE/ParE family toxin [Desulfobacter sp.]
MEWEIRYYSEKVRAGIDQWPPGIKAYYAKITERMQIYGPNLGMPFTRSMGQGLFEIRARGKEGIGRAFFCAVVENEILILHEFIKRSQKTPKKDLETAQQRLKEVKNDRT